MQRNNDEICNLSLQISQCCSMAAMLDAMKFFLAVAESGNFSKVARERTMAVSSVTRRIDGLEAELGVRLFHRSSRQLLLTDAGEQFRASALQMVSDLEGVKAELSALQTDPHGLLTVTAPSGFGRRHVVPAAMRFLKLYPQIQLNLHLSDDLVDLAERRIDVAIRIGKLPDSDLVATKLAQYSRLACASPDYLARAGWPATPQDLLKHNCLTIATPPLPAGWWSFAGTQGGSPLPVRGSFQSDDTESLLQAALHGIGIVHLASWLVGELIAEGRLISLFPQAPTLSAKQLTDIHAVRLPGRSHATRARLFIEHLKTEFDAPTDWHHRTGARADEPESPSISLL